MNKIFLPVIAIIIFMSIFLFINVLSKNYNTDPESFSTQSNQYINDINPEANIEPNTEVTLTGTLNYVHNNGNQIMLSFYNPHQGHISFIIKKEYWDQFPQTLNTTLGENLVGLFYIGQTISVTGNIDFYQGDETIYITSPDQIQTVTDTDNENEF